MTLMLVDKSAYEQQRHSTDADAVLQAVAADDRLAICEIVALELLYSCRNTAEYERRRRQMQSLIWLRMDFQVGQVALDIQYRLVGRGQHRRPISDLLIAAAAIVHGATVLHYDKDFDLIADVVDLSARWIIPRGTSHRA